MSLRSLQEHARASIRSQGVRWRHYSSSSFLPFKFTIQWGSVAGSLQASKPIYKKRKADQVPSSFLTGIFRVTHEDMRNCGFSYRYHQRIGADDLNLTLKTLTGFAKTFSVPVQELLP